MDVDTIQPGKRITLKRTRPNPLFQSWLEELQEEAKEKKSKHENMLNEALSSLSKYPLPLQSGAECAILKGFDKRLCTFLDKRLEVYNNIQKAQSSLLGSETEINTNNNVSPATSVVSSPNKEIPISPIKPANIALTTSPVETDSPSTSTYKPVYGSGSYALLVALLKHSNDNERLLKKDALIEYAQKYCNDSFESDTVWSEITTLISKGLVNKNEGAATTYSLSKEGFLVANNLLKNIKRVPAIDNFIDTPSNSMQLLLKNLDNSNQSTDNSANYCINAPGSSNSSVNDTVLEPNSFNIVLLIDKNETNGGRNREDLAVPSFIYHEFRSLKVGDYAWVAKDKYNRKIEVVLPYIVERKRMDDLAASIKDGRFHEQKFRLRRSGIKNVIYLVEQYGNNINLGLPPQSLSQALANTRLVDNFTVHITKSLAYTVRFLSMMTKRLVCMYKNKCLKGRNAPPEGLTLMTFDYFNKCSIKNKSITVKETFIKMLLQLKGVSVEKAVAITNKYKTPHSLINAYKLCDQKKGEMLLANIKYGNFARNIGPTISKTLYQLFSRAIM